ncbi:GTP 3',8-cyclase MoaA [Prolixibacter denitrificans]|uniref:Cyclic pyranopterin phosphate synthase n=1 Tax=Prolixibacter denitrificans TaxID=1541063 RepID=A0A2P8CKW5_9BACT|nr:radical SAM protein [Prolixibacter denitrificans]PSK85609.1 cyclic pyranopterin phosphate synthase [Prolixibacter denitrificans]GET20229.1 GTP 3',8-cyclase [Prolixibacter denitrificans]
MFDRYNREITYLRISVTDRCNLRCRYCMPEEGVESMRHEDILSFEEIAEFVRRGAAQGITKVRLTGGEPLVRKGIVGLVHMLAQIDGIEEVAMTTNGILLEKFAPKLKEAGLSRVNISLDTTDPEKYSYITRGGDIDAVFRGIDAALKHGLTPVKINCVIRHSEDEEDAQLVTEFAKTKGLKVQYIHQMDLETGSFSKVKNGEGGNCRSCNRIRLMANGCVKPCLFNPKGFNVRQYGFDEALQLAVENKPKSGSKNQTGAFYKIGG